MRNSIEPKNKKKKKKKRKIVLSKKSVIKKFLDNTNTINPS